MSDPTPVRESLAGSLQVGCGLALVVGVPLWATATVALLNVRADWRTMDGHFLFLPVGFLVAGFWAAVLMVLLVPVLRAIFLVWRGFDRIGAARAADERAGLDASVADAAKLPEDAWGEVKTRRPDEPPAP